MIKISKPIQEESGKVNEGGGYDSKKERIAAQDVVVAPEDCVCKYSCHNLESGQITQYIW